MISLTTGIAILPVILLWPGLLPGLITPTVIWAVTFFFLGANLAVYRKQLMRFPSNIRRLRTIWYAKSGWFPVLFLLILVFQMMSLPGLFVTPGDDAKLYSLISQRFIEVRGIPNDWGTYAASSWYTERIHLLLPGFSSIVAFLVPISGFDVPTLVSVLASLFRSLTAATLYGLVWVLTRRRIPSLLTMFVYGFLTLEPPVNWFSWGGMAELSGLSLLPIAAAGTLLIGKNGITSRAALFWVSLVVGGMSLLHPFVLFYYLAFVLSLVLFFLSKRQWAGALTSCFPALLGLGLSSGPILHAIPEEVSIAASYSIFNPAWTPVFSWTMTVNQAFLSLASRAIIVYGFAVVIFLLTGPILIRRSTRVEKTNLAILGLWAFILFLLHENNPNGLFLVTFPLWYRIDPNRTFSITSLAVSVIVSLILEDELRSYFSGRHLHFSHLSFRDLTSWRPPSGVRLLAIVLTVLLVTTQVIASASILFAFRTDSPILNDDIQAFSWIKTQTPANATFFVNTADAGQWIPIYAARRVVLPFGAVTNYTLAANYATALTAFIVNPNNSTSLRFMKSMGVEYVYAGPARIFGRPGFNSTRIMGANLFEEAYHEGNVRIFRLR